MAINVAFCVDHGFTLPLAVALASLDQASSTESARVFVLHPGLSTQAIAKIDSRMRQATIEWIQVDENLVAGAHFSTFLSNATLYRLLIGELLPADVERVIYLDADTLVVDGLTDLYRTDLGDCIVGAVRDAGSPWAAGARDVAWRELGLDADGPYFNAGMMLVDLQRWRDADIGPATLDLLRRLRPIWGDQDALNAVLKGKWVEVARRWNLQTDDARASSLAWALWREDVERAVADPAVVHFTGLDKPWHYGSQHPFTPVWNDYLDRTVWSGWRPKERKPSRVGVIGRRLIEVARRLRRNQSHALPS